MYLNQLVYRFRDKLNLSKGTENEAILKHLIILERLRNYVESNFDSIDVNDEGGLPFTHRFETKALLICVSPVNFFESSAFRSKFVCVTQHAARMQRETNAI